MKNYFVIFTLDDREKAPRTSIDFYNATDEHELFDKIVKTRSLKEYKPGIYVDKYGDFISIDYIEGVIEDNIKNLI